MTTALRTLQAVLLAAIATSAVACAAPAAEEDAADGDQALAQDEAIKETIRIGENGEQASASTDPEGTQAASWRAYRVSKVGTDDFAVFEARSASGKPIYEVAFLQGGAEVQLRDPAGAPLALRKSDDGRALLEVAGVTADIRAIAADIEKISARLEGEPERGTSSRALHPLSGDVVKAASCGFYIVRAIGAGVATLTGASIASLFCPAAVPSVGIAAPVCVITAGAAAASAWATYENAKEERETCR